MSPDCRTFLLNRERAVDYLNMLDRIYVFDGFAGWDPEVRLLCCPECVLVASSRARVGSAFALSSLCSLAYLPPSQPKLMLVTGWGSQWVILSHSFHARLDRLCFLIKCSHIDFSFRSMLFILLLVCLSVLFLCSPKTKL